MEIPINKLKLNRQEKIIPDLSKKDFNELKRSIEKWGNYRTNSYQSE